MIFCSHKFDDLIGSSFLEIYITYIVYSMYLWPPLFLKRFIIEVKWSTLLYSCHRMKYCIVLNISLSTFIFEFKKYHTFIEIWRKNLSHLYHDFCNESNILTTIIFVGYQTLSLWSKQNSAKGLESVCSMLGKLACFIHR